MNAVLLGVAAVLGFFAVALGAFGAHGLRRWLATKPDGAQREAWWTTGAHYHLAHAIAAAFAASIAARAPAAIAVAGWAFVAGIALFSGSLYAMTLSGVRKLGAVTPLGGLAFLVGWAALAVAAIVGA